MSRIAGAGGGGCFLGHTLIRTPDGPRPIEALQPGDLVVSFDDRGELHHAKILMVHTHEGERVNRYRLWGGAVLDATPNHWVLNQFNAFVEIDTLGPDDCLVDENGHLRPIVDRAEFCVGTAFTTPASASALPAQAVSAAAKAVVAAKPTRQLRQPTASTRRNTRRWWT
jgi:hypothetical protein